METDKPIVKGHQDFRLYGSDAGGFHLEVWDHSTEESQRIDIALETLLEVLLKLEIAVIPPLSDEASVPLP